MTSKSKKGIVALLVVLGLGVGLIAGKALFASDAQPAVADLGEALELPEQESDQSAQGGTTVVRPAVQGQPGGGSTVVVSNDEPEVPQQPEEDEDADNDGVEDDEDNCVSTGNADQSDFDHDGKGDACDADDDNDGLSDAGEVGKGTNPYNKDTDGDGWTDGKEVMFGSDPTDPSSEPNFQIQP